MHHDIRQFRLPVEVHVSKREAGKHMERTKAAMDAMGDFQGAFDKFLNMSFERGRRLGRSDIDQISEECHFRLESLNPILVRELRREPTRARPKADAREILAVVCYGGATEGNDSWHLSAMRLYVDRKRAWLDQEHMGLSYHRHLLERAIERKMVPREGAAAAIEEGLYHSQGLLAAWRRAIQLGLAPVDHDLHIPFGDGLFLGVTFGTQENMPGVRYVNNRILHGGVDMEQSPFRVLDVGRGDPAFLDWVGRTAVPGSMLSLGQLDYRDAVVAFCARHAEIFRRIAEEAPWTHPELTQALRPSDVQPELDAAAHALARIVTAPRFRRVYEDRRYLETNPIFQKRMFA